MAETGENNSAKRNDPLTTFCFRLILNIPDQEQAEAYFQSVSGLKIESEVVSFKEGGLNHSTRQLVGPTKWPNIVLRRGFTGGNFHLLKWRLKWLRQAGEDDNEFLKRASGRVVQLDSRFQEKCSWRFVGGWPCVWEGPEYDATKSELAIETLEIAHEGLEFHEAQ